MIFTPPMLLVHKRRRRGFSLLEIMIAVMFFAIAFVSLMNAYNWGVFADLYLDRGAMAVNLAQEKMEDLRRGGYAGAIPVPSTTTETPGAGAGQLNFYLDFSPFTVATRRYPFTRITTIAQTAVNLKRVTVTVSWPMKAATMQYILTTYLANY